MPDPNNASKFHECLLRKPLSEEQLRQLANAVAELDEGPQGSPPN